MKSDAEIRDDVIDELRRHPQMPEPDATGVAVTDGAVTLTGHPVDAHHSGRRQGPPAHLLAQPAR